MIIISKSIFWELSNTIQTNDQNLLIFSPKSIFLMIDYCIKLYVALLRDKNFEEFYDLL